MNVEFWGTRPPGNRARAASAFQRITHQPLAELERRVAEHRAIAGVAAAEDADPAELPRRRGRGRGGVAHGLACFLSGAGREDGVKSRRGGEVFGFGSFFYPMPCVIS